MLISLPLTHAGRRPAQSERRIRKSSKFCTANYRDIAGTQPTAPDELATVRVLGWLAEAR